ncbi:bifunctional diguanylate cyclase/phosphodiesterase [Noviherbaspirillum pedocola]|uniref:PAS domain S-box protein n=1 Tax=Noviherbaspirillum pedocola TaxID=2801341 RepID=A0A934STC6_9BURK|nr:PAS domain S-box protein [Noviherbaspirillum pedocola]MBK4734841.1 PAS domain S-box protein [Noviherbaspirillum pedocola]
MLIAPLPANEAARLRLLKHLELLDTPPEESFDRITRLLAGMLQVPIALVSLIDENRQWFKSRIGTDVCETPRDIAFCAHALHEADMLVIEDAHADTRFADNPLVVGPPFIRFYAGVPLRSHDGLVLGTLCAIDTQPRKLAPNAAAALRDLARTLEREIAQREAAMDTRLVQEQDRRTLALSEARFSTVFQRSPTGKALVDLQGRFIDVNPKLCEITGYAAEELLQKTFAEITHPDDLEQDLRLLAELMVDRRQSFSMEKRYLRRDGSWIWVQISVSLVRDEEGTPVHLIAVIQDIADRKRDEALQHDYQAELEHRVRERTAALAASREMLQTITDNLPVLIAHVNRELRYTFNNDMYRQVFGVDTSELTGKPLASVLRPELYQQLLPYFRRALAGERVTCDNVRYSLAQPRVWSGTYVPDVRDGEVVGFYVMSQDVTERKRAEKLMHDKAMLDPLTGLPNRRALHEKMEQSFSAASASGASGASGDSGAGLALFFMDLDGFKGVNDSHGHETGDALLRQVAQRIRQVVRQQDFVSRLAGDEFVVVAEHIPVAACERVAESIRAALARPFVLDDCTVCIGTSIGIALRPPERQTGTAQLLSEADAAMYEAKRRGRNGYCFAPTSPPAS